MSKSSHFHDLLDFLGERTSLYEGHTSLYGGHSYEVQGGRPRWEFQAPGEDTEGGPRKHPTRLETPVVSADFLTHVNILAGVAYLSRHLCFVQF